MKRLGLPQAKQGFGTELEFHIPYGVNLKHKGLKFLSKFKNKEQLTKYTCLKSDCSCGNRADWHESRSWYGLELNLGIFPFDKVGIKHFEEILNLIYQDIRFLRDNEASCTTPISHKCGFHLHMSRDLFSSIDVQANFYQFFYHYQNEIFKYFAHPNRADNHWAERLESYDCRNVGGTDHYTCVNNTRHGTVELRHTGMTSRIESLVNWIRFVYLAYQLVENTEKFRVLTKKKSLLNVLDQVEYPTWINPEVFLKWIHGSTRSKFPMKLAEF